MLCSFHGDRKQPPYEEILRVVAPEQSGMPKDLREQLAQEVRRNLANWLVETAKAILGEFQEDSGILLEGNTLDLDECVRGLNKMMTVVATGGLEVRGVLEEACLKRYQRILDDIQAGAAGLRERRGLVISCLDLALQIEPCSPEVVRVKRLVE